MSLQCAGVAPNKHAVIQSLRHASKKGGDRDGRLSLSNILDGPRSSVRRNKIENSARRN